MSIICLRVVRVFHLYILLLSLVILTIRERGVLIVKTVFNVLGPHWNVSVSLVGLLLPKSLVSGSITNVNFASFGGMQVRHLDRS